MKLKVYYSTKRIKIPLTNLAMQYSEMTQYIDKMLVVMTLRERGETRILNFFIIQGPNDTGTKPLLRL